MRAVVQRVTGSQVTVDGETVAKIKHGLNVLVGVEKNDSTEDAVYIANKLLNLRIFSDECGKLNKSVTDIKGEVLLVSQFTLLGDVRHGLRPSFTASMDFEGGKVIFDELLELVKKSGLNVSCGVYGADMLVDIANDGPVTILLDSKKLF